MLGGIPAEIFAWVASNDWETDGIGIPIGGLVVTITNLFSMADIVTITELVPSRVAVILHVPPAAAP